MRPLDQPFFQRCDNTINQHEPHQTPIYQRLGKVKATFKAGSSKKRLPQGLKVLTNSLPGSDPGVIQTINNIYLIC